MGLGILGDRALTIADSTAFVSSDLLPPAAGEACGEPEIEAVGAGDGRQQEPPGNLWRLAEFVL
jgi:hypothetical protein